MLRKKIVIVFVIGLFIGASIPPNTLIIKAEANAKVTSGSVIICPSSSDSYVDKLYKTENFGDNDLLDVASNNTDGAVAWSYVKFDLSTIPMNMFIESAYLKLYCCAIGTSEYIGGTAKPKPKNPPSTYKKTLDKIVFKE